MKPEEIVMRQEIRQMMGEIGINRNTMRELAETTIKQEVEMQVQIAFSQNNVQALARSAIQNYEFDDLIRSYIKSEIKDAVTISVDVNAQVAKEKDKTDAQRPKYKDEQLKDLKTKIKQLTCCAKQIDFVDIYFDNLTQCPTEALLMYTARSIAENGEIILDALDALEDNASSKE